MDRMAYLVSSSVSDMEEVRRSAIELDRPRVQLNYGALPATPRTSTEVICSSPIKFNIDEDSSPRYLFTNV
jgi:hypothetical protein